MSKKNEEPETRQEYTVTVLSRDEITTYKQIGVPLKQMVITYVASSLAPATIRIMKDEYSLEKEQAEIRADIERRLKRKAESYTI